MCYREEMVCGTEMYNFKSVQRNLDQKKLHKRDAFNDGRFN